MTTNKFETFAKDIFDFLKTVNNITETRERHEILSQDFENLDYVLKKCSTIRTPVYHLINSNLIDEIIEQETFFKDNYYNFLDNSASNIPDKIQDIKRFYDENKEDSYFKFKEIYARLSSNDIPKSFTNKYELKQLFKEAYTSDTYRFSCSVCQARIATGTRDLDHFLSKKYFPILCIQKDNLIPMCKMCNSIYKRDQIPNIPIVHPNIIKFPISNITFKLVNLNTLFINEETLADSYLNYIQLMNLKERIHHEDIKKEIETIIHSMSNRTIDKIKKEMSVTEIKDILKTEIETHIRTNLNVELPYKHLQFQTLENILNDEILLLQIVIPIHFMINRRN